MHPTVLRAVEGDRAEFAARLRAGRDEELVEPDPRLVRDGQEPGDDGPREVSVRRRSRYSALEP